MIESKRQRSPNFPYATLRDCVDLVRMLHDKVQTTQIPVDLAYRRMDLNPSSSVSLRIMGSLTGYGLLNVEGSGKDKRVNVSELGRRIAIDTRPDSPEIIGLYQKAIFNEPMMQKAWNEWRRNLPRDQEAIETVLRLHYDFSNERAANRFASVIIDNYSFAQLDEYFEGVNNTVDEQDEINGEENNAMSQNQGGGQNKPPKDMPDLTKYTIPLDNSQFAYIYLPLTISVDDAEDIPEYINLILKKIRRSSKND